ncbi:MAG: hypothetical protein NTX82_00060 [Candidatus Parcubacteria bacterium]|nr:hypothetical protein [Candidatus Parcubacteria bacterium]
MTNDIAMVVIITTIFVFSDPATMDNLIKWQPDFLKNDNISIPLFFIFLLLTINWYLGN